MWPSRLFQVKNTLLADLVPKSAKSGLKTIHLAKMRGESAKLKAHLPIAAAAFRRDFIF